MLTVSVSQGLRNPLAQRRSVADAADMAITLGLHKGIEAWWSVHSWLFDRRGTVAWQASAGVAIDIDYHDQAGAHVAIPREVVACALAALRPVVSLIHATPRGVRAIFAFAGQCSDAGLWDMAARGACALVERALRDDQALAGLRVDEGASLDRARLLWAPRATVNGVERCDEVLLGAEPEHAPEDLARLAAPKVVAPRAREDFAEAAAAFNAANPLDFSTRTCPTCGHRDCWGPLPADPTKGYCWSVNHGDAGVRCERGYVMDALDVEVRRRGLPPDARSRAAVLRETGLLEAPAAPRENASPPVGNLVVPPAMQSGLEHADAFDLQTTEEPPWLIEDVLAEQDIAVIAGASQSFKTFLALEWALHLTMGLAWEGNDVRAVNVLYLPGEGQRGIGRRVMAWMRAHPQAQRPAGTSFRVTKQLPNLTTPQGRAAVRTTLRELVEAGQGPRVVFIDTLSTAMAGADENEMAEMTKVTGLCRDLRDEFGCAVVILHHLKKEAAARGQLVQLTDLRGSGALGGDVDTVVGCARAGNTCRINLPKLKESSTDKVWSRRFEIVPLGQRPNGKPITSGWLASADPAEAAAASEQDLRDWIRWLLQVWSVLEPKGPTRDALEMTRPDKMGRNVARGLISRAVRNGYLSERRGINNAKLYSVTAEGAMFAAPVADFEALRNGEKDDGD